MITIKPFKAIRPTRDKAHLVATMPYYTYKKNVLEAKMEQNPYTFLHVINPEFHSIEKSKPNSDERFSKIKNKFQEFITDGIFIQDSSDCLYVYRQTKEGNSYLGIIGGASVNEYNSDKIKKHEQTITSREETFSRYLKIVSFHAEPVLLFHEKNTELDELLNTIIQRRAEYEFTSTEKIKHEIWVIDDSNEIKALQSIYAKLDAVYIADGHHRCASSARYAKEYQDENSEKNAHFLAYFISEEKMNIIEYNRLVKDLNGLSSTDFLASLTENFIVTISDINLAKPKKSEEIGMYLDNTWYQLKMRTKLNETDAVESLDTAILSKKILTPILNIVDLKTDNRIDFISGNKGMGGIADAVNNGKAAVGFALFPVSTTQLKKVADANLSMPPKSTWIEPKLRSGLTIYPL